MPPFQLEAPFKPCGDQGQAIDKLVAGIAAGRKHGAIVQIERIVRKEKEGKISPVGRIESDVVVQIVRPV